VVKLNEQSIPTGEEDDEITYKERAALYRFIPATKEWKERGRGDIKLMKGKHSGLTRLLMRQDKTLKVATNQVVHPEMELRPNSGSDRSWVWRGRDYADESPADVTFAIRFKDSDTANVFKKHYDDARKANATSLKKQEDNSNNNTATANTANSSSETNTNTTSTNTSSSTDTTATPSTRNTSNTTNSNP